MSRHSQQRGGAAGFTLAELIVALVITAFIGTAAALAIAQMVRARDGARARETAARAAYTAADTVAQAVTAAARDPGLATARLLVRDAGDAGSELLTVSRSIRPVRGPAGGAEGGLHEVQFRLQPSGRAGSWTLWRRVDPTLDDVQDGGGVAAPLADGIESFTIDAYNGSAWRGSWDSDVDGMPHAVRVRVTARTPAGPGQARSVTAAARRVLPIDRVPIPPAGETSTDETAPPGGAAP